ncbi:uncharacterized protein LOC105845666 isoform X4 [Hydra vulgaris]|uniref:uncharacterized protein LOC105845666 isoform X4 n=1 Tax=Hydra vulgaris TaxID=6087 RepID=UPI0032EA5BD8
MNVNHGDETEVDNDGEDEIYHKRPDKDKALKKYNDYMDEIRKTVSLLVSNTVTTASSSDMTATAVTSFTTTIASPSDTTTTGWVMLYIFIKMQILRCSVFTLSNFYFIFPFFSIDIW